MKIVKVSIAVLVVSTVVNTFAVWVTNGRGVPGGTWLGGELATIGLLSAAVACVAVVTWALDD